MENKKTDFNLLLKFGKSSNKIGNFISKPFIELPFGMVRKELPALRNNGLISESIDLIMKHQFHKFNLSEANGNEIIAFVIWMDEQYKFITNIELTHLQSDPEPEMLAAGISRLNEFGINPIVEKIAKDWNMKPDEIEKVPYFKIYEKMKMDKVQGEINRAYQKIIEEKAKRK